MLSGGINASSGGYVVTNTGNLNVRSIPSTSGDIIASVEKNSYLTLERLNGEWWYAEFDNGRYGYLYSGYIKELDSWSGRVDINGSYLNVRSGPGASYRAFDALADGAEVIVIGETAGWGLVLYDGDTSGYVNLSYISENSGLSQEFSYPSVQLDAVSYKQYDSRWADLYVGSSGNTVKNIGCTLTCVAMAESYRTKTTVTPAYVVRNYSFTSGGALYWPAHYRKDYSSDYLSVIYDKLIEGKPVIFHSNNRNGSSHWVLVTGFTGGNVLTADKFIINDPGSSSRTTLADHMAYYPNYSKLVY